MKKLLQIIDSVNQWVGSSLLIWFAIALVLVTVVEVILRFGFNRPTVQGPELMVMTGAALYALSWGYIHRHHKHIRIDIIYARFPLRGRAIIDIICALLFFFPVIGFLTYAGGFWTAFSWKIKEVSHITYWYPPLTPLRAVVFIGLTLFLLQGMAQFIRDLYLLARNKPL